MKLAAIASFLVAASVVFAAPSTISKRDPSPPVVRYKHSLIRCQLTRANYHRLVGYCHDLQWHRWNGPILVWTVYSLQDRRPPCQLRTSQQKCEVLLLYVRALNFIPRRPLL